MADFKISAAPGGAQTAASTAYNDLFPAVDVSVGASDNANVYYTAAVLRNALDRVRPTLDAMKTPFDTSSIGGGTWSWVNQDSTTASNDATGAAVFGKQRSSSDSISAVMRSLPSTPYSLIMEADVLMPVKSYGQCGLCWRDSSSGKIVNVNMQYDTGGTAGASGVVITASNYTNTTTFSAANNIAGSTNIILNHHPKYMKITDNGTNFSAAISDDGINWTTFGSGVSRTAFLSTPDQVGFYLNANSQTDYGVTPHLRLKIKDLYFV